ncbi:hypothetical protein [Candidatus Symbiopectobacterium sp.]|uniref:hypothetical protein n=1 Tax=Candidatus Symbiopectobacterium sp. TaxID=2816440 RepID=UPI0025C11F64|nr:hypothetical protein [Candidatus Symbiopectobacterium sp.]
MVRGRKSLVEREGYAEIEKTVALAEGHAEPGWHSVTVAPFSNTTKNAWRFPDGSIIFQFIEADRKAKGLGMVLGALFNK